MWRYTKATDVISALGMVEHPEGGFFIETHRSGTVPMTSGGITNVDVPTHFRRSTSMSTPVALSLETNDNPCECLTLALGRESRSADGDVRRNCLTSIIWMPLLSKPTLPLAVNLSDHVHYYQGGNPFEYIIYNPQTRELHMEVLGPAILEGQRLQVVVPGGMWKCGRMIDCGECDFSLIGEAVSPGFDYRDFSWVTAADVLSVDRADYRDIFHDFITNEESDPGSEKGVDEAVLPLQKALEVSFPMHLKCIHRSTVLKK